MTDLERELAEVLEFYVYAPFVEYEGHRQRLEPATEVVDRAMELLEKVK